MSTENAFHDILPVMSEARNIIILILVLLFIFVGVGVAISRLNKKTAESGKKTDTGFIQQIFGGFAAKSTPTTAPTPTGTFVVTKESNGQTTYTFAGSASVTPVMPKGVSNIASSSPTADSGTTQDSQQPGAIPSTGANPLVVLFALIGLAGGLYLHRKA